MTTRRDVPDVHALPQPTTSFHEQALLLYEGESVDDAQVSGRWMRSDTTVAIRQ